MRTSCILHLQLSVRCRYAIIISITGCECVASQHIRHRTLTYILDATLYYCRDCIVANQAYNSVGLIAVSSTIVFKLMCCCRDCHWLAFHLQRTILLDSVIVASDIHAITHDLEGY